MTLIGFNEISALLSSKLNFHPSMQRMTETLDWAKYRHLCDATSFVFLRLLLAASKSVFSGWTLDASLLHSCNDDYLQNISEKQIFHAHWLSIKFIALVIK